MLAVPSIVQILRFPCRWHQLQHRLSHVQPRTTSRITTSVASDYNQSLTLRDSWLSLRLRYKSIPTASLLAVVLEQGGRALDIGVESWLAIIIRSDRDLVAERDSTVGHRSREYVCRHYASIHTATTCMSGPQAVPRKVTEALAAGEMREDEE